MRKISFIKYIRIYYENISSVQFIPEIHADFLLINVIIYMAEIHFVLLINEEENRMYCWNKHIIIMKYNKIT